MSDFVDWTLVERIAPAFLAVATLGWWLSGKFRAVEEKTNTRVEKLENIQRVSMDAHEIKDQLRHDQNLTRFERISVALAKLGSDNGTHAPSKET